MWSRLRYAYAVVKSAYYPGLVLTDDVQYQYEVSGGRAGGIVEVPSSPRQLLEQYESEVWTFVCVSRKADVIADLPWALKREKRGAKDEVVTEHPARDFLYEPGPGRTWQDLMFAVVAFHELAGRSFTEIAAEGDGPESEPRELVPLLPHQMRPLIHPQDGVTGYSYRPNRDEQRFEPHEIMWINSFSPLHEYGSVSPTRGAFLSAILDQDARMWNQSAFRRGAAPGTIINPKVPLPRDERDRIQQHFDNATVGSRNWGKTYVAPKEVEIIHASATPRDMGYRFLQQSTMTEILAAYGVPPIWVGLETANYATARTQESVAIRRVCIPLWNRIAARITQDILPRFPESEGLYLAIDETELRIPDEEDDRHAKTLEAYDKGIITLREARAKLGYQIGARGDQRDPEDDAVPADETQEERELREAKERREEAAHGGFGGRFGGRPGGSEAGEKAGAGAAEADGEAVSKAVDPQVPPEAVVRAAALGLRLAKARGIDAGERALAGAEALVAATAHGLRDLRRLAAWHRRHDLAAARGVRKGGSSNGHGAWGDEDNPSRDWVEHLLRGGDAGAEWASAAVAEVRAGTGRF